MFTSVSSQICRAGKCRGTLVALVGFLSCVDPHVLRENAGSGERSSALTLEGIVCVVSLHVNLNTVHKGQNFHFPNIRDFRSHHVKSSVRMLAQDKTALHLHLKVLSVLRLCVCEPEHSSQGHSFHSLK